MILHKIALVAAVILPFWNLPLIFRVIKRRSSLDISIFWAVGVWLCLLLMAPAGFISPDIIWRVFSIINFIMFSGVFMVIIIYRRKEDRCRRL